MVEKRRHRRNANEPGHAHELTFSCYQGYHFLSAERVCGWLAESIKAAREVWNFDVWAFVFMPKHVHLVIHPRDVVYDIANHRKAIKAPVAARAIAYLMVHAPEWIPKVTRQRGDQEERLFWQSGGGYDRNVVEPKTLLAMIDYIQMYFRQSSVGPVDARQPPSVRSGHAANGHQSRSLTAEGSEGNLSRFPRRGRSGPERLLQSNREQHDDAKMKSRGRDYHTGTAHDAGKASGP